MSIKTAYSFFLQSESIRKELAKRNEYLEYAELCNDPEQKAAARELAVLCYSLVVLHWNNLTDIERQKYVDMAEANA